MSSSCIFTPYFFRFFWGNVDVWCVYAFLCTHGAVVLFGFVFYPLWQIFVVFLFGVRASMAFLLFNWTNDTHIQIHRDTQMRKNVTHLMNLANKTSTSFLLYSYEICKWIFVCLANKIKTQTYSWNRWMNATLNIFVTKARKKKQQQEIMLYLPQFCPMDKIQC